MGKVKLLLDVVEDLRSLANSIQAIAEVMTDGSPSETPSPPAAPPASEPKAKNVTLEEVRAVLAEKSHDGLTAEVRELLKKYGAEKLSAIDPRHYLALLADAEVLGNGS